jgi:hypothetical protein
MLWGALFQYLDGDGHNMHTTQYEIFKNPHSGTAVRIATVQSLGQAEQTLYALAWLDPGDYFTRDCATGEIVEGTTSEANRIRR